MFSDDGRQRPRTVPGPTPTNCLVSDHQRVLEPHGLTNLVTGGPLAGCARGSVECAHVRTQVARTPTSAPWQTDYVWASGSVRSTATVDEHAGAAGLSDHLPIVVSLEVV